MMLLIVILLVVLCFSAYPAWGLHNFGYYPSGALGVVLLIVVILLLMGRL